VDGSIPLKDGGIYSTIAGRTNFDMLLEAAEGAAAIVAVGSCAAFGGLPNAQPNPTGAVAVSDIIKNKPIINISGCPPIPAVITGVLAHYLTFGALPALDDQRRPKAFFGETIHDRCYRRPFYDQGKFAKTFDDEGARNGWCLYELGCKGPTTHNACATTKWNGGTSFPIESGHGCIGCSEPKFWDAGSFYAPLPAPTADVATAAKAAAVIGAVAAVTVGAIDRGKKTQAQQAREKLTVDDLKGE
jgi:hydrogenase small subunit